MADRRGPQERLAAGNLFAAEGRHAEAAQVFRGLLREHPGIAELHFNLGNALKGSGDFNGAERAYGKAIALKPDLLEARFNLANLCRDQGRPKDAQEGYAALLAHQPGHVGALANLGSLLQSSDPASAATLLQRALTIEPAHYSAANTLGLAAADAGRWLRRARALAPDHPAAWSNLADQLRVQARLEESDSCYRAAISLDPGNAGLLTNLGLATYELQQSDLADRFHGRALAVDPQLPQAQWNRALTALAQGKLAAGWQWYEARFAAGATPPRQFPMPRWQGEPLAGRTLLVWREQGIGDELTWATCLPDLLALGNCLIECEPRLASLYARSFPAATVRADDPRAPAQADLHVPIGSLPLYLRPTLGSFVQRRLLVPDPVLVEKWRGRLLALGPGLKIGLSWRSLRTRQGSQLGRSYTTLADWQALFELPGVQVVSLQYDDDAAERDGHPLHLWPDLDLRNDIENVAALIDALDGVITVSNSVAALAGCLARPTLEIALADSWSWLGTGTSLWFAGNRAVFRLPSDSDWTKQIAEVVLAVARWRDCAMPPGA